MKLIWAILSFCERRYLHQCYQRINVHAQALAIRGSRPVRKWPYQLQTRWPSKFESFFFTWLGTSINQDLILFVLWLLVTLWPLANNLKLSANNAHPPKFETIPTYFHMKHTHVCQKTVAARKTHCISLISPFWIEEVLEDVTLVLK